MPIDFDIVTPRKPYPEEQWLATMMQERDYSDGFADATQIAIAPNNSCVSVSNKGLTPRPGKFYALGVSDAEAFLIRTRKVLP